MDGRSANNFKFYCNDCYNGRMFYTWEKNSKTDSLIDAKSSLILLLNDYKSYTNLKLEQNLIPPALLKIE